MEVRVGVALLGLIGGLAWIGVLVLDRASANPGAVDALLWVGLALVGVATLGAGAGLVSRNAAWLRVLVALCFAALVGSILALLTGTYDDEPVFAGCGAVAVLASVMVLLGSRAPSGGRVDRPRTGGAHAR